MMSGPPPASTRIMTSLRTAILLLLSFCSVDHSLARDMNVVFILVDD